MSTLMKKKIEAARKAIEDLLEVKQTLEDVIESLHEMLEEFPDEERIEEAVEALGAVYDDLSRGL